MVVLSQDAGEKRGPGQHSCHPGDWCRKAAGQRTARGAGMAPVTGNDRRERSLVGAMTAWAETRREAQAKTVRNAVDGTIIYPRSGVLPVAERRADRQSLRSVGQPNLGDGRMAGHAGNRFGSLRPPPPPRSNPSSRRPFSRAPSYNSAQPSTPRHAGSERAFSAFTHRREDSRIRNHANRRVAKK